MAVVAGAAAVSAAAEIGTFINKLVQGSPGSGLDRQAFVKSILEGMIFEINSKQLRLNALVFNLGQPYDQNLEGVVRYWSVQYDGTSYGVWLFQSGTFENLGEGTYENWGMYGLYEASGPTVLKEMMGRLVTFR